MTKQQFINHLTACYRIANMSDSDNPQRPTWTNPKMAADVCSPLDTIFHNLRDMGILTSDEHQEIYDTL